MRAEKTIEKHHGGPRVNKKEGGRSRLDERRRRLNQESPEENPAWVANSSESGPSIPLAL